MWIKNCLAVRRLARQLYAQSLLCSVRNQCAVMVRGAVRASHESGAPHRPCARFIPIVKDAF